MTTAPGNKGKAPPPRPGAKGAPGSPGHRPPSYDNTIEGNLKQLLSDQGLADAAKDMIAEEEAAGVDAPLVRLVNALLLEAVKVSASDIHIEPFENMMRVRFRIDGVLQEIQKIPHKLGPSIVSRMKIMADLDICERRLPQDGTIHIKAKAFEADFRVSSLPSVYGEKIVVRVMGRTDVKNDLAKLNIPETQLRIIRESIQKPDGMVLVTGPTGSGKTTTLYAALNELNDIGVSVFTAEDPVEGDLPGVTQCQVNAGIAFTFASVLRALLRQDPDVILVGEIRDQETAEISIKAALTGHMVLSTLHTNCAAATISRLLNMGIAPYLITSSLNCIVAQRLVRKICDKCKQEAVLPEEALEKLGSGRKYLSSPKVYHGRGCKDCRNSGYRGRTALYEVLVPTNELTRLILAGAPTDELKDVAREAGMTTLREHGLQLVAEGVTTLEEVLSATNEDPELGSVRKAVAVSRAANSPQQFQQTAEAWQMTDPGPEQALQQPTGQVTVQNATQPAAITAQSAPDKVVKALTEEAAKEIEAATKAVMEIGEPKQQAPIVATVPAAPATGTARAEAASRWKSARPGNG